MSHYKTIKALGTPIVVHSGISKMLGSMTASVLLSYIMYWSDRTDNPLGFYRTLDELKNDTALTERELRTARKLLVDFDLIDENYQRVEHKLYFKFKVNSFDLMYGKWLFSNQNGGENGSNNSQNEADLCLNNNQNKAKPHDNLTAKHLSKRQIPLDNSSGGTCQNVNSLYTKITTKITAEECEQNSSDKSDFITEQNSTTAAAATAGENFEKNSVKNSSEQTGLISAETYLKNPNRILKYQYTEKNLFDRLAMTLGFEPTANLMTSKEFHACYAEFLDFDSEHNFSQGVWLKRLTAWILRELPALENKKITETKNVARGLAQGEVFHVNQVKRNYEIGDWEF